MVKRFEQMIKEGIKMANKHFKSIQFNQPLDKLKPQ